jgi:general secretion pathway protein G
MKTSIKNQMENRMNGARQRAFTLVELLLVLSILALLAGLVLPKLTGVGEKAKVKATIGQIGAFKTALDLFEAEVGQYPPSSSGLNDLVNKPRYAKEWHQGLDKVPLDPWGNPYIYVFPGRHNPNGYDISSMGPDQKAGTSDDIGNWDSPTK